MSTLNETKPLESEAETDLDSELLDECNELLCTLMDEIPNLWEHVLDEGILERTHRSAHTLKGLTGFLDVEEMNDSVAGLNDTLLCLRDGKEEVTQEAIDQLMRSATRLKQLLASASGDDEENGLGARGEDGGGDVSHQDQTAILKPGEWRSDENTRRLEKRAAAGLEKEIAALSEAIRDALSGFGVQEISPGKDEVGEFVATERDLTVLVKPKAKLQATFLLAFDTDIAKALANRIAASTVGETGDMPPGEEAEFVTEMLGEMVVFTIIETLKALKLPPEFEAPRFVEGRGIGLSPEPRAIRSLPVTTELGRFVIGIVPSLSPLQVVETAPRQARPTGYDRKIVIADDSTVMRKTIERALKKGGYQIIAHATNGREAIEEFRRHRPDLVVLDIRMPVMGGIDALKIIHAEDPSARVLISSSIVDREVVGRGFQAGAVGYITKPFKPEILLEIVDSLFEKPGQAPKTSGRAGLAPLGVPTLGIYRVGEPLGEGGMATVYEGYDPSLSRKIALKVIKSAYGGDVGLVVRFLEEARAVARINHPNVVSIYFAGSDRGKHFFAMELLAGPDLSTLVRKKGPLPMKRALHYIQQGALGLAAAKRQGLIHCDVKPSNLLFGADEVVEVTDFGIARQADTKEELDESAIMGTPGFMAPEQVVQLPIDHRTDIYSLGATLYFLLTGEPPYTGDDPVRVALAHVNEPVPTIHKESPGLNELLSRMMAKAPRDRFDTYQALLSQIERAS